MLKEFEVSTRGNSAPLKRGMQIVPDAFFEIQNIGRSAIRLNVKKHFRTEIVWSDRGAAGRIQNCDRAISN